MISAKAQNFVDHHAAVSPLRNLLIARPDPFGDLARKATRTSSSTLIDRRRPPQSPKPDMEPEMSSRFVAAAGACALASLFVGSANAAPMTFVADLVPLNNSGVHAHFSLVLNGTMLTVNEHATGLEPNEPHPQHIHGLLGADAPFTTTASAADDVDHDGFIELAEGMMSYGPILLPLTSPPGGALSDFPTAPGGVINFSQTYDLTDSSIFPGGISASDLFPLNEREIVIHGMTVPPGVGAGTPGEVNGTGGYLAVLPVADGLIRAVPEPTSLALLLVGLVGCWSVGRRVR